MAKFWWAVATGLCLILLSSPVSAHVLRVDGGIGAVLHILPDDAPAAETPVTYELSFRDERGTFSLSDCDCMVSFIRNGTTVETLPLTATSDVISRNVVTFSKPGVYNFHVTGEPRRGAEFNAFTLDYTVRVSGDKASVQRIPILLWIGMGMVVGLILLYAYASDRGAKNHKKKENL